MTALVVMDPAAPSIGPGLKPNDRSLDWTSLTSSRASDVGFDVVSAGAGLPLGGDSILGGAVDGRAEATLSGGDEDGGVVASGAAGAGGASGTDGAWLASGPAAGA